MATALGNIAAPADQRGPRNANIAFGGADRSPFEAWKSTGDLMSAEDRRAAEHLRTARERQMQSLNLQRDCILSQKTSNPVRRAALEAALAQVEAQIHAMS